MHSGWQSNPGLIGRTINHQYFADLLVWYHLAWMGESVRRNNEFVMRLMAQCERFSYADRLQLFKLIGELIEQLIPRYRKLAESGQIELSTTPHYHPLAPLLIDFSSARDSQPMHDLALLGPVLVHHRGIDPLGEGAVARQVRCD